jgi:hypothetical protein
MAYPVSPLAPGHGSCPSGSGSLPGGLSGAVPGLRRPASLHTPLSPALRSWESDHQLEKLEFALAVAITRNDPLRIQALRDQIAALGGNCEEPGT